MKQLKRLLVVTGCVAALCMGSLTAHAQNRWDPAQMRQRRIDAMREQMDVKDDAEWKVIADAMDKVMQAQFDLLAGRMGGFRGPRPGGDNNTGDNNGDQRRRRFGTPSQEQEDLQKAIDAKASNDEIKAKLAKLQAANKAKMDAMQKAEDNLRALLDTRQEAIATLGGLLN